MFTKILITALSIFGLVAFLVLIHDYPKYADGEPTAIVQEFLLNDKEFHHIVISLSPAIIGVGDKKTYTAEAFNQYDKSLGDVTADTTFSVQSAAGGSWQNNVYTSEVEGLWTVTGNYLGKVDTANLTVKSNPTQEELEDKESLVEETWDEEYLGRGKWVVTRRISTNSGYNYNSIAEYWDEQLQSQIFRLREYTNDLPLDDKLSFQEGLWETKSQGLLILTEQDKKWYVYEESGHVTIMAEE